MGISKLKPFLTSIIGDPIIKVKFSDIKINSLCIDINIFLYKFITAIRKTGKDLEHDGKITSHIIGLKNQINLFERLNIDIIYVFDGKPPREKSHVLKNREKIKNEAKKDYEKTKNIKSFQKSFFVTNEIISDTKEYLKLRGIKYIDLDIEADLICANLVKNKIVDCVYSTDYDILAFGSKCLINKIDYKKKIIEYISLPNILKKLNINYEKFVEMVVISGCDYCRRVENMSLLKSYKLLLENDIKLNKHGENAKNIFMKNLNIEKKDIKKSEINKEKLKKFLMERNIKH